MICVFCDKTYGIINKYNNRYDDRYNGVNEDGNDNDNAAARSGSDGPIFDPITTPQSRLGLAEEDWATTTIVLHMWCSMYLHVGL